MKTCCASWGSHGCDLAPHHEGNHLCLLLATSDIDDDHIGPPWVYEDTGGWCNWWDGKQLVFYYLECATSAKASWPCQLPTCTGGCK